MRKDCQLRSDGILLIHVEACQARHSPKTSATVCIASAVRDLTVVIVR